MVSSSRLILFRAELMASLTHSAMLVCSVSVIRFIRAKTSGLMENENAFVSVAFFITSSSFLEIEFKSRDEVLLYYLFCALLLFFCRSVVPAVMIISIPLGSSTLPTKTSPINSNLSRDSTTEMPHRDKMYMPTR